MIYHKFTVIFLYFVQINAKSLKKSDDNRVEKREIFNSIEDLFPDWVPFKNKHGDKLGEFVPVQPKRRIMKRLALPLSYALKSFSETDDYYEKGGPENDAGDYFEMEDLSDTSRSGGTSMHATDTETVLETSSTKDEASKTDVTTKDKSEPAVEKQIKRSKAKTIDVDYTDDDDEGSSTYKGKGDDLALKVKAKNTIETGKAMLDIEQKLIINALNKEEAMQAEERQRDIEVMDNRSIDKYSGQKTHKKDYDDYEEIVKDIGIDKYKYHPIRKPSPVRTSSIAPEVTRSTSETDFTSTSKVDIVPTGKMSVFRNPGMFVVFDDDPIIESNTLTTIPLSTKPSLQSSSLKTRVPPKTKVTQSKKISVKISPRRKKTTSSTTMSTTPTTLEHYTPSSIHNAKRKKSSTERVHISFVPQDTETKEGEPTLFFPKKRNPKKDLNIKQSNLPIAPRYVTSERRKYFEKLKPPSQINKNSSPQGLKKSDQKYFSESESTESESKETDSGETRFIPRAMSSSENNGLSKGLNRTSNIKNISQEVTRKSTENDPMEPTHRYRNVVVDAIELPHRHNYKEVSRYATDPATMIESTHRHNTKNIEPSSSDLLMESTRRHNIKDDSRETSDSMIMPTHRHYIKDVTPEGSNPIMDSTRHMHPEEKHHEAERGGVKEHHSEHHSSHDESAKKEYSADHKDVKTAEGHHDKGDHVGSYHDHGGHDETHHDEKEHHGTHLHKEHGKKHAEYEESGRHSKGHSTKGSHDIHKKDEYEKNVEFFEEEGDSAEEHKKSGHKNIQKQRKGDKYDNSRHNSGFAKGELKGFRKTGYADVQLGRERLEDDDSYAKQLYTKQGKKSHDDSRKWIFHHSHPAKTANFVVIDRRSDPLHHDQLHHGPQYYG